MKIAFFTSSLGDTDLAKATIAQLIELGVKNTLFIVPLTAAAATRTEEYVGHQQISRLTLAEILSQPDALSKKRLSEEDLAKIAQFVKAQGIQRAFIGVTSVIDAEAPFQIAQSLNIPCTIAYEYMFKPVPHAFWGHVPHLAVKPHCQFAVPLKKAAEDILSINSKASVSIVGHLCIDRAQIKSNFDKAPIKHAIKVDPDEELAFISGTTQPIDVDNQFIDALLFELSKKEYPNLQIRFGLHPGISDPTLYLQTLLKTCAKYPLAEKQFKIILTTPMEKKLLNPELKEHPFILRAETSGADMSQAADRVAQAVPGALLNESALAGKPSYFHVKTTTPYLPEHWFSESITTFFTDKPQLLRDPKELELKEPSPPCMMKLMLK